MLNYNFDPIKLKLNNFDHFNSKFSILILVIIKLFNFGSITLIVSNKDYLDSIIFCLYDNQIRGHLSKQSNPHFFPFIFSSLNG